MPQIDSTVRRLVYEKGDTYRVYAIDQSRVGGRPTSVIRVHNHPIIPNGAKFTAEGLLKPFGSSLTFEVSRFTLLTNSRGRSLLDAQPTITPDTMPAMTASGIASWINRAKIDNVGKVTAVQIRERAGDQLPALIGDAQSLARICKIPMAKAKAIAEAWKIQVHAKTHAALLDADVPPALAMKLINAYGNRAYDYMRQNPWRLAEEFGYIGFTHCDKIGTKLEMAADHPERVRAGLIRVIRDSGISGHCGLPFDEAVNKTAEILALAPHQIKPMVEDFAGLPPLVLSQTGSDAGGFIQYKTIARAEATIADFIYRRSQKTFADIDRDRNLVDSAAYKLGFQLDPSQREGAITALGAALSIITGGPGVGKTTVQRVIAKAILLGDKNAKILFMAPTGRAAKRITDVTGFDATTIHRALEFSPEDGQFTLDANNPLMADHIIIDEFSMVDVLLAAALFEAIGKGTKVTIVGDADQLPSVGAGNLLADLIASRLIPTTRLNVIHRQGHQSGIVAAAHRINGGDYPATKDFSDIHIELIEQSEAILRRTVELATKVLPAEGFDPIEDIQVLAPMKKGPTGTISLNAALKAAINPVEPGHYVTLDKRQFSRGDKVMQTRNDYETNVFNGEIGKVTALSIDDEKIDVNFGDVAARYDDDDAKDLLHAYASTIHKSQGSEFPAVILVLDQDQWMASRRLIYTAITRAKKRLIILTQAQTLNRGIKKTRDGRRFSSLPDRLQQLMETRAA